jgi:tRNA(Ile)-lysidine synthase TilS/MesJ
MQSEIDGSVMEPDRAFCYKLDLFMHSHVLPTFNPEHVRWLVSLSGGKDSFAMVEGLRKW